jgi:glycosyltransferase involved in cell wall biosynthesis
MHTIPTVSGIIPFLNAGEFLKEAVESVIHQTYDHWELLLIDDGSLDVSTAIARHYAERYPEKIHYLEHEGHQNHGTCASRNLGIRFARGEYIAPLDADDVWLPHKLEQQIAIMESQPEAAMLYGRSQYWNSWTGDPEDIHRDFIPELGIQADTLFQPPILLTLCHPLGRGAAPCPSDMLLRREAVERIGGFEEGFLGMYQLYEDQAFLAKVYFNFPVFVSSQCWDKYRLHPNSCSSTVFKAGQYHTVRLFFLNWLERYLSDRGAKNTSAWSALQRAFWPYRYPFLYRMLNGAYCYGNQVMELLPPMVRSLFPLSNQQ